MKLLAVMNQKHHSIESVITITQSTYNGLNLMDVFRQKIGRMPVKGETAKFIIPTGIDIVAPNVDVAAIDSGTGWVTDNVIKIENRGRIYGRGGDGGLGALVLPNKVLPSTNGQDGGPALNSTIPMFIENYSIIAGGGGGGAGSGSYKTVESRSKTERYLSSRGFDSNGGGGAPFGAVTLPRTTGVGVFNLPGMTQELKNNLNYIFNNANAHAPYPSNPEPSNLRLFKNSQGKTWWYVYYLVNNPYNYDQWEGTTNISQLADVFGLKNGVDSNISIYFPIPNRLLYPSIQTRVRFTQEQVNSPNFYFTDTWSAGNSPTYYPSVVQQYPQPGLLQTGGVGGFGTNNTDSFWGSFMINAINKANHLPLLVAGAGGAVGENGKDCPLTRIPVYRLTNGAWRKAIDDVNILPKDGLTLYNGAKGGIAGYIKKGAVTIVNKPGGLTKGRN